MSSGRAFHLQRTAALRIEVLERVLGIAAQEHLTHAHAFADPEPTRAGAYLEPQLVAGRGWEGGDGGGVRHA